MNPDNFQHLLDEQTRQAVIEKLKHLSGSIAQIEYWYENGLKWLEWQDSDRLENLDLSPFKFIIPNNQYKQVNEWIIANYLEKGWGSMEEKKSKYLNLVDLIEKFDHDYEVKLDKRLIQEEMRLISRSFELLPTWNIGIQQINERKSFSQKYYADFDSFRDSKEYNAEPDYSKIYPATDWVLQVRNGYIVGQYYNYLKEKYSQPTASSEKCNLPKTILLMHYSGELDKIKENYPAQSNQARYLNTILGYNYDNIYGHLSEVKAEKPVLFSANNLEFVAATLDKFKRPDKAELARKDLEKVYQRKLK